MRFIRSPLMDPRGFLYCLGLQASDPRLTTLRTTVGNRSVLHYVASCFAPWSYDLPPEFRYRWADFGVELLRNGADAYSLDLEDGHGLSQNQARTPFMVCAGFSRSLWYSDLQACTLSRILLSIRLWADMVRRAGIDLCQYGTTEAAIWKSLQGKEIYWDRKYSIVTRHLQYGPTPAEWSLLIQCYPTEIEIFELQDAPGSFPRDHRLPEKICWRPSDEEAEEGAWKQTGGLLILSPTTRMENLISKQRQEEDESVPLVLISSPTQDDAGVVVLLLRRSSRPRSSVPRSRSQPPPLFRRKRSYASLSWLPDYHLCPNDYRWHVQWDRDGYRSSTCPCIQTTTDEPFTAQSTRYWKSGSFLASISQCQDGQHPRVLLRRGHTGRADCPWKCATVNLDKLHVPAELKPYHPMVEPIIF